MDGPLFPGYRRQWIETEPDVRILVVTSGGGTERPPLLLLHGHPQTHAIWHRVAPALAQTHTLVLPDLRGYGDSSKPATDDRHQAYAKRTMANYMVAVMDRLGHRHFAVLAHDRGARVAHRMAADHADAVSRMVLLDIAPTLAMYEQTTEAFARAYWHWFFLIQPAGIDLEHDRADRDAGRRISLPLMVLWGANGIIARCFDPLTEWQRVAADVRGGAVPCGHYIPEEAPDALLAEVIPFLTAAGPAAEQRH